jgi:hypothetical protein
MSVSESSDNVVALGRGDFFAVDRRTWAMAFDTAGLHAALAYLVLARGSLADMRTTSWSAEAINHRTRLNWRQAKESDRQTDRSGLDPARQAVRSLATTSCRLTKANGLRAQKRRSPSKPVEMTVTRGT